MLELATSATGRPLPASLLITGGFGALCGSIAGATVALALGWAGRRFRISRTQNSTSGVPCVNPVRPNGPEVQEEGGVNDMKEYGKGENGPSDQ